MIVTSAIPTDPGVYLFKDSDEDIIYVGKAKNLRSRVSSYFKTTSLSMKTQLLVKKIDDVEFIIVDNEVEALLLENKLIKKHEPKYNILLKDSKTYAYIKLTDEKFPRIHSTRLVTKKGKYFGPYTQGSNRKEVVEMTNKLFKLRTCRTLPKRACLNFHIGLCTAPCIHEVSNEEYQQQISDALVFLKGNTKPIMTHLTHEMLSASEERKFEIALEKKRQIEAIEILQERQKVDLIKRFDQDVIAMVTKDGKTAVSLFSITKGVISKKKDYVFDIGDTVLEEFVKMYYTQNYIPSEIVMSHAVWDDLAQKQALEIFLEGIKGQKVRFTIPQKGEKKRLVELASKNALFKLTNKVLKDMHKRLNLPTLPRVIECFDMSNLSYDFHVGGMVQYIDGKPHKNGYRRFEIREERGFNDDFASMREVIFRRYKRLLEERKQLPDLIIVDGGKGQLGAALESLKKLGLRIPIFGLAKKQEEIFLPGESESLQFPKNSPMMLLVRQIRDSAHRFVITYNRKKREMKRREEFKKTEET